MLNATKMLDKMKDYPDGVMTWRQLREILLAGAEDSRTTEHTIINTLNSLQDQIDKMEMHSQNFEDATRCRLDLIEDKLGIMDGELTPKEAVQEEINYKACWNRLFQHMSRNSEYKYDGRAIMEKMVGIKDDEPLIRIE